MYVFEGQGLKGLGSIRRVARRHLGVDEGLMNVKVQVCGRGSLMKAMNAGALISGSSVLESVFRYFISCKIFLLTYLSFSFLSCKMEALVLLSWGDCKE